MIKKAMKLTKRRLHRQHYQLSLYLTL